MSLGNLLIVDDEKVLLQILSLNLEDYADQIFTAENGQLALDIFNRENIQCIICDINMPGMNGMEVLRKIRAIDKDIPFIFFSGHGSPELMKEAAKYNAFDFLNKPQFDKLEEIISYACQNGFTQNPGHLSEYRQQHFNK